MKKLLSVVLSVIMILSAACVTAFATETHYAEDAIKSLDFEKGIKFEIRITDIPLTVLYVKGDKTAAEMSIDGHNLKLILKDNTLYTYFTDFPFIYFELKNTDMPELEETLGTLEIDALFIESYEAEYDSKIYYVEKYASDDSMTLEYYFLDDELKMIRSNDDENYTTEIKIISTEVDDDVFDLPFFSFNITPIFEFLSSLFNQI